MFIAYGHFAGRYQKVRVGMVSVREIFHAGTKPGPRKGIMEAVETKNPNTQTTGILSAGTRWLAIATGLLAFASVFVLGWGSFVESSFLILGAIVQSRSPQPGNWLMWVSAFLLSVMMLPIGVRVLGDQIRTFPLGHDRATIGVISLSLGLVLTQVCCDIAFLIDAAKPKCADRPVQRLSRSRFDWVVWIAALGLSTYYIRNAVLSVHPYRLYGGIDMLLTGISLTCVVLLFDVALVVDAVKNTSSRTPVRTTTAA